MRLTNSDIAELTDFRHHLHRHPEVSGQEEWTAAEVVAALRALGEVAFIGVLEPEGGPNPRGLMMSAGSMRGIFVGSTAMAALAAVRAFARDLGRLNREIARVSTSVYLVIAGLPQKLK